MEINIQRNSSKPLNLKIDDYTDNYINLLTQLTNIFLEKRNLKGVTKSDVVRELINMGIKNTITYIRIEDIEFRIIDVIKEEYEYFEEINCLSYLLEKKKILKENDALPTDIMSFLYTFKKVNNIELSKLIGEEIFINAGDINKCVTEYQNSFQEYECCDEFKKYITESKMPEIYLIYKTNIDLFCKIDAELNRLYYTTKEKIFKKITKDGNIKQLLEWEKWVEFMEY